MIEPRRPIRVRRHPGRRRPNLAVGVARRIELLQAAPRRARAPPNRLIGERRLEQRCRRRGAVLGAARRAPPRARCTSCRAGRARTRRPAPAAPAAGFSSPSAAAAAARTGGSSAFKSIEHDRGGVRRLQLGQRRKHRRNHALIACRSACVINRGSPTSGVERAEDASPERARTRPIRIRIEAREHGDEALGIAARRSTRSAAARIVGRGSRQQVEQEIARRRAP